jgi:hypothetical protein
VPVRDRHFLIVAWETTFLRPPLRRVRVGDPPHEMSASDELTYFPRTRPCAGGFRRSGPRVGRKARVHGHSRCESDSLVGPSPSNAHGCRLPDAQGGPRHSRSCVGHPWSG